MASNTNSKLSFHIQDVQNHRIFMPPWFFQSSLASSKPLALKHDLNSNHKNVFMTFEANVSKMHFSLTRDFKGFASNLITKLLKRWTIFLTNDLLNFLYFRDVTFNQMTILLNNFVIYVMQEIVCILDTIFPQRWHTLRFLCIKKIFLTRVYTKFNPTLSSGYQTFSTQVHLVHPSYFSF